MKIDRIVTAVDENTTYMEFVPIVAKDYKKFFGFDIDLALITSRDETDPLVQELKELCRVHIFNPIGIETGVQAKASRMYLASTMGDENVCLIDVDMFLLNKQHVVDLIEKVEGDCIFAYGANAYLNTPDAGKFPMVYTTAKGSTFKDIVNPLDLEYAELFKSWYDMQVYDHKEAVNNPFNRFSDESLLRALLFKWASFNQCQDRIHWEKRDDFVGSTAMKRIDRPRWEQTLNIVAMYKNYYIDCAPPRPLWPSKDKVKPVLDYMELTFDEVTLKNWSYSA